MRTLPCGCRVDASHVCELHRLRWYDRPAGDGAALVALSLFIGMIAVWIKILE